MSGILSLVLELAGVACLVWGYRKADRNIMLAGAVLLWLGGGWNDLVAGFQEGYAAAQGG